MLIGPSLQESEKDTFKIVSVIRWLLRRVTAELVETLTANRTYYVSTSGLDTADGLSALTPFRTIQFAVDTASAINRGNFIITILVADGSYGENVTIGSSLGTQPIQITGNTTTPANVITSSFTASNSGFVNIGGFRTTGTIGFKATTLANMTLNGACRAACSTAQVQATTFANVTIQANFTLEGVSSSFGFLSTFFGSIQVPQVGIIDYAAPTFTVADMFASTYAQILFQADLSSTSSATGPRFFVDVQSFINVRGRGGGFPPGTTAGSELNGGKIL